MVSPFDASSTELPLDPIMCTREVPRACYEIVIEELMRCKFVARMRSPLLYIAQHLTRIVRVQMSHRRTDFP